MTADQHAESLLNRLKEIYVFVAMEHPEHAQWAETLKEWRLSVEALTGWKPYEVIQEYQEMVEEIEKEENAPRIIIPGQA